MHVIEVSDTAALVRIRNGCLNVSVDGTTLGSVPVAEVSAVLLSSPHATCSVAAIASLAGQGTPVIFCDPSMKPAGMVLPFRGHHGIGQRVLAQANAAVPLRKRLWKQLIQSKIIGQAAALESVRGNDAGLRLLAKRVRSGDTSNVEARAARRYWGGLFGRGFRRRRGEGVVNRMLDYGYAVLRACIARSICVSGLHPSIGIHHHNRANAFALADDLIEPYRPAVDQKVVACLGLFSETDELTSVQKKELAAALRMTVPLDGCSRSVEDAAKRSAASLAGAFLGGPEKLSLPWIG
jgi:CRISPR-associated protein Cas1